MALFMDDNMMDLGKGYLVNKAMIYGRKLLEDKGLDPGDSMETKNFFFVNTEEIFAARLEEVLKENYTMVMTISTLQRDAALAAAYEHPTMHFVHVGSVSDGPDNYIAIERRTYESWYVASIVAGATTVTKKICFISPPSSKNFIRLNQMHFGAQIGAGVPIQTDTPLETRVQVMGMFGLQNGDWERMHVGVERLYKFGCDVLAYNGEFGAEAENIALGLGMNAIGFDRDERLVFGERILTSIAESWDNVIAMVMEHSYRGTLTDRTALKHREWYGLETGVPVIYDPSFKVPKLGRQ
eukprot:TRINITY_DN26759_c0_g1_i1.p1 TRINITY_DN26759_c0_g1~~TRINITY_DN26759_c0_g1_i1.p1  ORF type:complete len:332 (+),score=98.46 TRINITY_DN26759_c0_g1_i1:108-998(+)